MLLSSNKRNRFSARLKEIKRRTRLTLAEAAMATVNLFGFQKNG